MHEILLEKLERYSISSLWFRSYLENRTIQVRSGSELSVKTPLSMGVPQGSVLGPLLFAIYLFDLPSTCKAACLESYADDTQLYLVSRPQATLQAAQQLSEELTSVGTWFAENRLSVNAAKTQFIVFGTQCALKCVPEDLCVQLNGSKIRRSASVKNLGLVMDQSPSFAEHVTGVVRKATRALMGCRSVLSGLGTDLACDVVNSLVFSIMDYCISIWGCCAENIRSALQRVQNFAVKSIFSRRKFDHVTDLFVARKWLKINERADYFLACSAYRSVYRLNPEYLCDRLQHARSSRLAAQRELRPVLTKLVSAGDRAFSARCTKLWNSLPTEARLAPSLAAFKSRVKGLLSERYIPTCCL